MNDPIKRPLFLLIFLVAAASFTPIVEMGQEIEDDFIHIKGTTSGGYYPYSKEKIPVQVSGFYISPSEVTLREIRAFCAFNEQDPTQFEHAAWGNVGRHCAAVNVTWFDGLRYCNWLSQKVGFDTLAYRMFVNEHGEEREITPNDAVYWEKNADKFWSRIEFNTSSKAYRLPTEVEWEYAASGFAISQRKQRFAGTDNEAELTNFAWFDKNTQRAQSVQEKNPNIHGIYDMSGNVWEWVFDAYGGYYDEYENQRDPFIDGTLGTMRRMRGGGWHTSASNCAVEAQFHGYPNGKGFNVGLRLVRSE